MFVPRSVPLASVCEKSGFGIVTLLPLELVMVMDSLLISVGIVAPFLAQSQYGNLKLLAAV
jgi:hypothetical protein